MHEIELTNPLAGFAIPGFDCGSPLAPGAHLKPRPAVSRGVHVGMFDYVRCRYPLPHHQDTQFHSKDLMRFAEPDDSLDGVMDSYEITRSGRLRRQVHEYKLVKTLQRSPSFDLKPIKSWWVNVSAAHGDVSIYASERIPGGRGHRWIEFRLRFSKGRVQHVQDRSRPRPNGTKAVKKTKRKRA